MPELLTEPSYEQILGEIGEVFADEFDAPISHVLTAGVNEDGVLVGDLISGGNYYYYAADENEIGITHLPELTEEINEYARGFIGAGYGLNLDSIDTPFDYLMGFYHQDAQVKCTKGGTPCGKVCLPKGSVCRKYGSGGNAAAVKGAVGRLKSPYLAGVAQRGANLAKGVAIGGAVAAAANLASRDPSIRRGAQVAAERVKRGATKAGEEIGKGVEEAKESVKATAQRVEQQVKKGQYGKAAASVAGGAREVSKIAGETGESASKASAKDFNRAGKAVERGVKGSAAGKAAKATSEQVKKAAAETQANIEKAQSEVAKGARKASRVAKVVGGRVQRAGAKAEKAYNEGESAAREARRLATENANRAAKGEVEKAAKFIERQANPKSSKKK